MWLMIGSKTNGNPVLGSVNLCWLMSHDHLENYSEYISIWITPVASVSWFTHVMGVAPKQRKSEKGPFFQGVMRLSESEFTKWTPSILFTWNSHKKNFDPPPLLFSTTGHWKNHVSCHGNPSESFSTIITLCMVGMNEGEGWTLTTISISHVLGLVNLRIQRILFRVSCEKRITQDSLSHLLHHWRFASDSRRRFIWRWCTPSKGVFGYLSRDQIH